MLFQGVRPHAGRIRTPEYGDRVVTFGDQRSVPSEEVADMLQKHFRQGKLLFDQLDDLVKGYQLSDVIPEIIKGAIWLHADFIRIHPFMDGNGRTGRLIATYYLRNYGLPSFVVEAPKAEYIDCLNHFYKMRDIDPLVHFSIRLIGNSLR